MVRSAGVTFLVVALLCGTAAAIQVDYYAGNALSSDNPLNLAHVLVSIGGDDDVNGSGSRHPQSGGLAVANGIPDGVEVSVLEWLYDTPSAPSHGAAVAAFETNLANLWAAYGCPPGANVAWWGAHDAVHCDNFGSAPAEERICWDGNVCDAMSQPFCIRTAADQTVSESTEYYANFHYLLCFGYVTPLTTVFDFDNGMTVNSVTMPGCVIDRSLVATLGANADFDGDGQTNLQEWNSLVSAVRAITPGWLNPGSGDTLWDTLPDLYTTTSSRGSKDQMIGWYIDAAILNQAYTPALFNLEEGPQIPETTITGGGFVEVGDRVELTASAAGATGYQWYKNGSPILDETLSTLVIDPVALSDAGEYFCRITYPAKATVDTETVTLVVFAAGTLPVSGAVGLGILAGICAIAGTRRCTRRR